MPCGLAISSTSAPNARIVRIFSAAKASELTIRRRYPFTEHTNASELPVLPPVYSTMVSPGPDVAARLGALDHRQRHAVLVRASRVVRLELDPHLGHPGLDEARHADDRGVADGIEDGGTFLGDGAVRSWGPLR